VTDVLADPSGALLIATDHGGIWVGGDRAPAFCLSDDWPAHRFNRLAQGPDGLDHRFAGRESLWVTDPAAALPYLSWQQISSFVYGTIWDILVLDRVIVVAADQGLYFSVIPPAGAGPVPAADQYAWRRAFVDTDTGRQEAGVFFSLAEAPSDRSRNPEAYWTVLAGASGMNAKDQRGIFLGGWDVNGDLVFTRSAVAGGVQRFEDAENIAVATSAWYLYRAYAAADSGGRLDMLLRSDDGGKNWYDMSGRLLLDTKKDLFARCDHQAGAETLAVAPNDPDVVAFGWFDSYVSFDGGQSWDAPGVNDDDNPNRYDNDHLHTDIHRLRLPTPPTDAQLTPASQLYAAGDGGIASIEWGQGATFIEGPYKSNGNNGNLEAVVLEGNNLSHYNRPSDTLKWGWLATITEKATGRGCIIQSDFTTNDIPHYEVLVPEGDDLVHYWRDNEGSGQWNRARVVSSNCTGPATFIQSDYRGVSGHGNFEAVVLEGTNLVHYFHDNSDLAGDWQPGATITTHAASWGCIIQSDYADGAEHKNFEVVVLEDETGRFGRALVHYWRDNAGNQDWQGPYFITDGVTGPAWLFQGDYPRDADHHNLELFVLEGKVLAHWNRDQSTLRWGRVTSITADNDFVSGPACAIQGNYGSDDYHGNFELIAPSGPRLYHYFRDNAAVGTPWWKDVVITHHAAHFRSTWNRSLPTLMFNRYVDTGLSHGGFGVSQISDNLEAGGLQDLGNVAAISADQGSPWLRVGGNDGHESTFPAATSPAFTYLPSGEMQIWYGSGDGTPRAWTGDPLTATLAPLNPEIIPLVSPDPALRPPPPADQGLAGDPRLGRVSAPQYIVNNNALVLLGAPRIAPGSTRAPVYGLFTSEPHRDPALPLVIQAGWQFLGAATVASTNNPDPNDPGYWPIVALGAASGATVYLCALTGRNNITKQSVYTLLALDVATQYVTAMPVAPAVGWFQVQLIEAVSDKEVYAATTDGRVLAWNGQLWEQPGSALPGSDAIVCLAVDPGVKPTAVFVATGPSLYASRDGTRSWQTANQGLPRSVEPSNLALVPSGGTAALHLSTYGRSTWTASNVRPH
jgi:hypothetical protein